MYETGYKTLKKSLLANQIIVAGLVFGYCAVYGITAHYVLSGFKLLFFIGSLLFALSVMYARDPMLRKAKAEKGILFNQVAGTILVFTYLLVYGISSITLLSGFELIFFMSSYAFALSIFYLRDPERVKKEENASSSSTGDIFREKSPCFINSNDLSWLVRELNGSLATIIGFCELLFARTYTENEKEYMLRNIYEKSLSISHTVNKISGIVEDSPARPKLTHEVIDLLADKNFK
ncbi:MAG: hypothetical protein A3B68_00065 [Candidatus Melainabacteria bacterium RIFCSPHIGHO2_02_FULL_34_12]|nr:MAG: hypothetical protein A3B68_00065 [Candidatus Melainabacteria bacterium RIFCSPHIGHO2_02_FULL_34_12]